jgi:phosphopantothenoylcysteine decarboxylase/phosphopantothenate--cysteine ligase
MNILSGKRIVLGITGSIAAYKAVDLASKLTKSGAEVDVVLTGAAEKLVSAISFSSVTGRRAYTDQDLWQVSDHVLHINLAENNHAMLIAPATANTIAKMAYGISDNLLSLVALASRTPPIVAPAMDGGMYANPSTQTNLKLLEERGIQIWGPSSGHLASGLSGRGRMLEPQQLMGNLRWWLGRDGELRGRKVLVTAGGTQEPLDPVRVLSNRSSGKQGYAIAQAAIDQGADVTLISGPTCQEAPEGADLIKVTTAKEMADQVLNRADQSDLLVMAAAVADYRPQQISENKIKKAEEKFDSIMLEKTTDILLEVGEKKKKGGGPGIVIGFAAETEGLVKNAQKKLESKNLDLIAANDVSQKDSGIGADQNQVTLIWKDGKIQEYPLMSKTEVAEIISQEAARLLNQ